MTHHKQPKELTTWFLKNIDVGGNDDVDQMNHCWTEQNMTRQDTNVRDDDDVDQTNHC
jgi:hypothetical protein